jgi:hypothetical protein
MGDRILKIFIGISIMLIFTAQVFSQDTVYIHPVHKAISKGTIFMGASFNTLDFNISGTYLGKTIDFNFRLIPSLGVFIDNQGAIGGIVIPSFYYDRSGDKNKFYLFGGFGRYYLDFDSPSWFVDFGFAMNRKEYDFSQDSLGYNIETIEKDQLFFMGLGYCYFGENITLEGSLQLQYGNYYSIDWPSMLNQNFYSLKNNQVISFHPLIGVHFYF